MFPQHLEVFYSKTPSPSLVTWGSSRLPLEDRGRRKLLQNGMLGG